jgi:hypothetical protein
VVNFLQYNRIDPFGDWYPDLFAEVHHWFKGMAEISFWA